MSYESKINPGHYFEKDKFLIHSMASVGKSFLSKLLPSMHSYMMFEGVKTLPLTRDGTTVLVECLFVGRYDVAANGGIASSGVGTHGYMTNIKTDVHYLPLDELTEENVNALYDNFSRYRNDRVKSYEAKPNEFDTLHHSIGEDQIRMARGIAAAFLHAEQHQNKNIKKSKNKKTNRKTQRSYFKQLKALECIPELKPEHPGQTRLSRLLDYCEYMATTLRECEQIDPIDATELSKNPSFQEKVMLSIEFLKMLNQRIRHSAYLCEDHETFDLDAWMSETMIGAIAFVKHNDDWRTYLNDPDGVIESETVNSISNIIAILNDEAKNSIEKLRSLNPQLKYHLSPLFPDRPHHINPASFLRKNLEKMHIDGILNDNPDLIKFCFSGSTGTLIRSGNELPTESPINCAEYTKGKLGLIGISTSASISPDAQAGRWPCTIS